MSDHDQRNTIMRNAYVITCYLNATKKLKFCSLLKPSRKAVVKTGVLQSGKKIDEGQIGVAVDKKFTPSRNLCCCKLQNYITICICDPEDTLSQVAV